MISVKTLHELGYRVCHAKNIGLAISVLRRQARGEVVRVEDIDRAARALEHAPLGQTNVVTVVQENTDD